MQHFVGFLRDCYFAFGYLIFDCLFYGICRFIMFASDGVVEFAGLVGGN